MCGSVAEWLGCRTYDQQVAGSNPGRPASKCNLGKLLWHNQDFYLWGTFPLISLPFLFLPLHLPHSFSIFPSFSPLPFPLTFPVFAARGFGERLSSLSGSGRSPAAKRFLVFFVLKILHLVSFCLGGTCPLYPHHLGYATGKLFTHTCPCHQAV